MYVKLFNAAAPVVGTTEADEMIYVPALTVLPVILGGSDGLAFATACKVCCVTGAAPTSSTSPTNPVTAKFTTNGS